MPFRTLCASFLSILLLTACGGGGGGEAVSGAAPGPAPAPTPAPLPAPPPPRPTGAGMLTGDYHTILFDAGNGDGGPAYSDLGSASADGAGNLARVLRLRNQGGLVDSATFRWDATYDVSLDRRLRIESGGLFTGVEERGRISQDGHVAVLNNTGRGFSPSLTILLQKTTGNSNASLVGPYHIGAGIVSRGVPTTISGRLDFDGVGSFTGTLDARIDGTPTPMGSVSGVYLVSDDGSLQIVFRGGDTIEGAILPGGRLLVAGGPTNAGGTPILFCALPHETDAGVDLLSTYYDTRGFGRYSDRVGAAHFAGYLELDGTGLGLSNLGQQSNGDLSYMPMLSTVEARVSPDGSLEIRRRSGDTTSRGALGQGGRFGFLMRATSADRVTLFRFLLP